MKMINENTEKDEKDTIYNVSKIIKLHLDSNESSRVKKQTKNRQNCSGTHC